MIFSIILAVAFSVFGHAAEKSPEAAIKIPTGLEWLQKSMGERLNDVIASMTILHQSEVPMAQAPEDYYDVIDTKLRRNPSLYETKLTELLADHLYEKEPAARVVLDRLKKPKGARRSIGSTSSPS